jgi:drug/metabolite transporter (DMT)-like permease
MEISLLLALGSAFTWGAGDFFGGLATRDSKAVGTTFVSQFVGLIGLVIVAILGAGGTITTASMLWGVGAGLCAVSGLGLFYEAMARGSFGPVASITSVLSGVVPIVFGLIIGERPPAIVLVGAGIAVFAIWLIAGEKKAADDASSRSASLLACLAGSFFGGYFVLLSRAGGEGGLWPLVGGRAAASFAVAMTIVVLRKRKPETKWTPTRHSIKLCAFAGVLDASANALYFLAINKNGLLSVVAVLASLYPASTILLARLALKERVNHRRMGGIVVGLFAVSIIAKGGASESPSPPDITIHAADPSPTTAPTPPELALTEPTSTEETVSAPSSSEAPADDFFTPPTPVVEDDFFAEPFTNGPSTGISAPVSANTDAVVALEADFFEPPLSATAADEQTIDDQK